MYDTIWQSVTVLLALALLGLAGWMIYNLA